MLPKTAIIGANSFIGKIFLEERRKVYPDTVGTSRRSRLEGLSFLDLTSPKIDRLKLSATGHKDALILAGIPGFSICEQETEFTRKTNVEGILNVVQQLFKEGVKPIFFSSDMVFDGKTGHYDDEDIPQSINEYGRQKSAVESGIKRICSNGNYLIVRLSKTFSLDKGDGSLLDEMSATLRSGGTVRAAYDQIFSPMFVLDVIKIVTILQTKNVTGVLNITPPEAWSRYDLALALAKCMGVNLGQVERISLDDLGEAFERPKNTTMKSEKMIRETGYKFTPTMRYIENVAENWKITGLQIQEVKL